MRKAFIIAALAASTLSPARPAKAAPKESVTEPVQLLEKKIDGAPLWMYACLTAFTAAGFVGIRRMDRKKAQTVAKALRRTHAPNENNPQLH